MKLVEAVGLCRGLRLGWVLAAVLWWVSIGVAGVVGFGCGLCCEFFLLFILVVGS